MLPRHFVVVVVTEKTKDLESCRTKTGSYSKEDILSSLSHPCPIMEHMMTVLTGEHASLSC